MVPISIYSTRGAQIPPGLPPRSVRFFLESRKRRGYAGNVAIILGLKAYYLPLVLGFVGFCGFKASGGECLEYKWVALTVTTIGILMVGLDARIVIIGLPQVAQQLNADAEQAIWITQSYVLANTVMLLLIGRLGDIFGRVRIYTIGFAIFTIGSGLTSLGANAIEVIAFRAFQGVGAALIFTNSIAIITDTAPKKQLGFFLGINQIAFRAGAMLGLTLSGVILSFLDWRALFYINIPIGILGTFWAQRQLKETALLDKNAKIDWAGFFTFTGFLLCLMIALTFGAYGTGDITTVYGLFAASIVFLGVFVFWETRAKSPLMDLHLFRIREVTGGVLAMLFNIMAWTAVLLLLSLQFQLVLGETPLEAGLRILPFELAFLALGPLSGTLADRYTPAPFIITGLSLSTTSLFLLSTTNQATSYTVLSLYMVMLGAGTGLFVAPNLRAMLGAVPINRRGIGSALFTLFLNIGFTVSLNLAVIIMSLTVPYSLITNIISAVNPASITAADKMLFANSLKTTYLALGIINVLAIAPSLLQINRKPKPKLGVERIITAEG